MLLTAAATPAPSEPVTASTDDWSQAPGGLFVPSHDDAAPTAGGLYVPGLEVPTAGSIVVAQPDDLEHPDVLLAQQRAELEAKYGVGAADAMIGAEAAIVDRASAEIEHDRIIDAFRNGGVVAAAQAASGR